MTIHLRLKGQKDSSSELQKQRGGMKGCTAGERRDDEGVTSDM